MITSQMIARTTRAPMICAREKRIPKIRGIILLHLFAGEPFANSNI